MSSKLAVRVKGNELRHRRFERIKVNAHACVRTARALRLILDRGVAHPSLEGSRSELSLKQSLDVVSRAEGSPLGQLFQAFAISPQEAVTIEGDTRDYAGRFFCPRCGSSVFSRSADETEVNLGSLASPVVPAQLLREPSSNKPPATMAAMQAHTGTLTVSFSFTDSFSGPIEAVCVSFVKEKLP
jgi:hypothetical protein